jgi:hypothetical protein
LSDKRHAVCLFCTIKNGQGNKFVVCRRTLYKQTGDRQLYGNALMPTIHGKRGDEPDPLKALLRKADREGGKLFAEMLSDLRLQKVPEEVANADQKSSIHYEAYWTEVTYAQMSRFSPCYEISGTFYLTRAEVGLLQPLDRKEDREGIHPRDRKMAPETLRMLRWLNQQLNG